MNFAKQSQISASSLLAGCPRKWVLAGRLATASPLDPDSVMKQLDRTGVLLHRNRGDITRPAAGSDQNSRRCIRQNPRGHSAVNLIEAHESGRSPREGDWTVGAADSDSRNLICEIQSLAVRSVTQAGEKQFHIIARVQRIVARHR